jgi:acetolactate synthase-1/2/3 large subunit
MLELPPDILNIQVEESLAPMPSRSNPKYTVHPDDADLKAATEIINNAKKPLFLGGSGVGFSHCSEPLKKFVEKTGIPFMLLNYGRGELPDNHPNSVMDMGQLGLFFSLGQNDVIVAAGIRFNWLLQFGKVIPPTVKIVRIDIDALEINRNVEATVGLVGDAGSVLEQLTPLVNKNDHGEWMNMLKSAGRSVLDYELRMRETVSDPIHPARLVAQIQKFVGDDAIYVADGGDTQYFGLSFSTREKAGVVASAAGLLGCLGTGIPFGMAAKLARPDKKVVVLNGDGSFGFNAMEFDTMVRHNIPVVCVIVNDCAWGMIKHSQEVSIGKDRLQCSELGLRHYEKIVEGLGGHGEFVTKDEEIIPALKRAFDSGKPACINVITDPTITSPATHLFYQSLKME